MYNSYGVGDKVYGSGRPMPTIGPVDKAGYKQRDRLAAARRNALLRRMQQAQAGNFMSPDVRWWQ